MRYWSSLFLLLLLLLLHAYLHLGYSWLTLLYLLFLSQLLLSFFFGNWIFSDHFLDISRWSQAFWSCSDDRVIVDWASGQQQAPHQRSQPAKPTNQPTSWFRSWMLDHAYLRTYVVRTCLLCPTSESAIRPRAELYTSELAGWLPAGWGDEQAGK